MARVIEAEVPYRDVVAPAAKSPAYQAYQVLHVAFTIAPVIAGLDKFAHLLVDWDQYLAPQIAALLPLPAHSFMLIVGVVEIVAGLIVALKPKIGAWIVALWLAGIIVNLLLSGMWLDVALRDLGLCLGAIALARLSLDFDRRRGQVVVTP